MMHFNFSVDVEMVFRRLCVSTTNWDSPSDIRPLLIEGLRDLNVDSVQRMNENIRATEAIKALAICHNVTPVSEAVAGIGEDDPEMNFGVETPLTYQASSPDEVPQTKLEYLDNDNFISFPDRAREMGHGRRTLSPISGSDEHDTLSR